MPIYAYYCTECGKLIEKLVSYDLRPNRIPCDECPEAEAEYHVSAPSHFKIGYEQNGRKAVQVNMGNGKKVHRSVTREQFEHKAGNMGGKEYREKNLLDKRKINESVYTKGYQEHLKKEKKNAAD